MCMRKTQGAKDAVFRPAGALTENRGFFILVTGQKARETEVFTVNIFLNGPVQIGKSTAIERFLSANPAVRLGGFATKNVPSLSREAERDVYILPPRWTKADLLPSRLAARRQEGVWTMYPQAFDEAGTAFLAAEGPFDLLLMDELGRMELRSARFRAAVLTALDRDIPVLGVVKPEHNPFLDAVRAHPGTRVLEVTEETRDAIPAQIGKLLGF